MSRQPGLSVVMSTRNRGQYLQDTIASILAQTVADFELVVGDNHSQDNSRDILEELARQDSRVRCFFNDQDLGAAAGHNKAFSLAQGRLFIFAGDDDPWRPDRLARLLAEGAGAKGVSCVYSDWQRIGPEGQPLEDERQRAGRRQPPRSTATQQERLKQFSAPDFRMALGLMPRDLFADGRVLRPLREEVGAYSDGPMVIRLLCRGEVRYLPEVTFEKREGHGWQYSGHRSEKPEDYLLHVQAYLWFWAQAREEIRESELGTAEKKNCLAAADRGFARVAFKLARQFDEKLSVSREQRELFFEEMDKFLKERNLEFAGNAMWKAKNAWPLVRGPMKILGLSK